MSGIDLAQFKPLSSLHEWADNYNTGDVEAIARSIRRFGFNSALRVWRGDVVMAGNHTLKALRLIASGGPKEELDHAFPPENIRVHDGEWVVLCVDVSHLEEVEARAFAIADNHLARMSVVDEKLLTRYLKEIADQDAAMFGATGFDEQTLALLVERYMEATAPVEPENPSEDLETLVRKWGVERGQLWEMPSAAGQRTHRLLCGDCRQPEDVALLCDEQSIQGVFTSPPYAQQRKATYGGVPTADYVNWWDAVQQNARRCLRNDGSFFINIKPHSEDGERSLYVFDLVLAMKREWGWRFVDEFCWLSGSYPGDFRPRFKNGFEPVYFFTVSPEVKHRPHHVEVELTDEAKKRTKAAKQKKGHLGRTYSPTGSKFNQDVNTFDENYALPSNVIRVPHDAGFLRDEVNVHPASFPVGLPEFFLKAYSDRGDAWFDPFVGSGTLYVAAERTQRLAYGIEIQPGYCALILERLSLLGLEPRLVEAK